MKLDEFVAVSGLPGVFKMVANRNNGLIVENIETGKRKFAPTRRHQFTPLASIGIYTDGPEDTLELKEVFRSMLEKVESNPPVPHNTDTKTLVEYFRTVMPTYDEDRVSIGDIKKVVKWFTYLNAKDMLSLEEEETEEEDATNEEKVEAGKEEE
ncbi:MAG: DUF5606 domain-containing protein [Saprospiraceae bacterium]